MSERPTIFALSSGRPPAAIAVVRISGPRAGEALKTLGVKIPEPRKAGLARVRDPASGEMIDEALALWFPGPHSETGEDVAELQLHGGRAVIAAALAALGRIEGLRPAEAGEFTRRAFENGKLDLTAVEGLADLVLAETEGQRRQAFRQMKGALATRAEAWRSRLIEALALVEARIDFSDETDVPDDLLAPALALVRDLEAEIAAVLADGHCGERLREGLVVAIAGPPNAGKSTLLNRLARREAAIVSPYAGTTRDVIEVHLDLGGLPVTLLDTAGIRDTKDPVELEGVRRAQARAAAADLVLWVVDTGETGPEADAPLLGMMSSAKPAGPEGDVGAPLQGMIPPATPAGPMVKAPAGLQVKTEAADNRPMPGRVQHRGTAGSFPPIWLVRNKIDLLKQGVTRYESKAQDKTGNESNSNTTKSLPNMVNIGLTSRNESSNQTYELLFGISASTGVGFDRLLAALGDFAEAFMAGAESALITRARHRNTLADCLTALRRAMAAPAASREDLLAEELRLAARALARLTGRIDVEDVLDVIFRDFCIGK